MQIRGTKPSTKSWWRWWPPDLPEAGWSTEADCAAPFAQLGPWRLKTLASLLVPWRFPYGNPGVSWRRTSPDSTRIEWFHINIAINIINWGRPPGLWQNHMGIDLGYMVVLYAFNGDSNGDIAAISGAADETTTNDWVRVMPSEVDWWSPGTTDIPYPLVI